MKKRVNKKNKMRRERQNFHPNTEIKFNKKEKRNIIIFLAVLYLVLAILIDFFIMTAFYLGVFIIIKLNKYFSQFRNNKKFRTFSRIFMSLIIAGFGLTMLILVIFAVDIVKNAPIFDQKMLKKNDSSIVYDKNGTKIAELGIEKRDSKSYDHLSENLINAIVATEDSRFFQHNGFDSARFFKATVGTLVGRNAGGASTITMQVIKNTFTDTGKEKKTGFAKIKRKFTDIYFAVFKLEKKFTKREILEFYANNQQLLGQAYGVEKTAQVLYGKSAKNLTLSEAAMLAGMYQAPTSYNPITNPKNAEKRRATVLNLMTRHGYISSEERDLANKIPVSTSVTNREPNFDFKYAAYIDLVAKELKEKGYNPYSDSLEIYTNMDKEKQDKLEDLMNNYNFQYPNVEVASTVINSKTGKIEAVIGRRKYKPGDLNLASENRRQIGSTAKPIFDYGPGMEFNNFSTYTIFQDEPYSYKDGTPIKNFEGGYQGTMTLCDALSRSRNVPALKAFHQVDNKKIANFAIGLGLKPEVNQFGNIFEAHALGAFDGGTTLEMAGAYSAFSNGGFYNKPFTVTKVVDRASGESKEFNGESKRAMSDSTAFMITKCLERSGIDGAASGYNPHQGTFAVKSGSTNFDPATMNAFGLAGDAVKDFWGVMYDTETVTATWYGYPKLERGVSLTGGSYRSYWNLAKEMARRTLRANNIPFPMPNSVVQVDIEFPTNPPLLASPNSPANTIRKEYFKRGTEPTESSNKYQKLTNVANLRYDETASGVKIKWDHASNPLAKDDLSFGEFGYRVYKNGTLLGFTTKNYYDVNDAMYFGSYTVITCYKNATTNSSDGVKIDIKPQINIGFNGVQAVTTYNNGATLNNRDRVPIPSDIIASVNGKNIVINNSTVKIKIYGPSGEVEAAVDSTKVGTHTISYSISYNGSPIGSKERKVVIKN